MGGIDWRVALLTAIGAPPTPSNLTALQGWSNSEGPKSAAGNNWLSITDPHNQYPHAPGNPIANNGGNPVWAFPSQDVGVASTASFLLHSSHYGAVLEAFRKDEGLDAIWRAINASPWCSDCQGGKYPVAIYQAVHGGTIGNNPVVGAPGGSSGPGAPGYTAPADSNCLIGGGSFAGVGIPCLFRASWGWALLGGAVIVGGAVVGVVGLILLAGKSVPTPAGAARGAVNRLAPPMRAAAR